MSSSSQSQLCAVNASMILNDIDVKQIDPHAYRFSIVGKYREVSDSKVTISVLGTENSQIAANAAHSHVFLLEDDSGQVPILYEFNLTSNEFRVPLLSAAFQCPICLLKKSGEAAAAVYLELSNCQVQPRSIGNILCAAGDHGRVSVVTQTGAALQHLLHYHYLSTLANEYFAFQRSNTQYFSTSECAQKSAEKERAKASKTPFSATSNNGASSSEGKDAFLQEFGSHDPRFFPLIRLFKKHAGKFEERLSFTQFEEFIAKESSVPMESGELKALITEACEAGLFYCPIDENIFHASFSI